MGYLAYYYFSNQETVPLTGRTQLVDMSRDQEMALGLDSYQQILSREAVLQSGEIVDQVREIGRRIAAVSEDPGFDWEFNVIQSEQANALWATRSRMQLPGTALSEWPIRSWLSLGRWRRGWR